MRSGKYNRRITIQETTVARGSAGGMIDTWSRFADRWAAKLPVRGSEHFTADQIKAEILTRFQIRHTSGISTKMRIITQSRSYRIEAAMNVAGRNKETEIVAVGDPDGAPKLQYLEIAVAAGPEPASATITWDTDAFASTQIRYRKIGAGSWTEPAETDTTEGVLEHAVTLVGLDTEENYEAEIRSRNRDLWTPGWANTLTWGIDTDGTFLPDGYSGIPTITTPPSVEDTGLTWADIEWETDIPAYHQVRTKRFTAPAGDWIEHDWTTDPKTTIAQVRANGLEAEGILYNVDVRSGSVGDGSQACAWTPGDNSLWAATTCTWPIVYSNLIASKFGSGKFIGLKMVWNTAADRKTPVARWRKIGGAWHEKNGSGSRTTSFQAIDYDFRFDDPGSYEFQVKNTTMCNQAGPWSASAYFTVTPGGDIVME